MGFQRQDIHIVRRFRATPSRMFAAWTTPADLLRWWGPRGFSTAFCEVQLKVGGAYQLCIAGPDGTAYWTRGIFSEIEHDKRIVAVDYFSDTSGNLLSPSCIGLPPSWPSALRIAIEFAGTDHETVLDLYHFGLPREMVRSCMEGWNESLDKLEQMILEE